MTIMECGMETSERCRRRGAQETGRDAPRLQAIPGATSFPRKREPTGGANGREIPAYAGMTMRRQGVTAKGRNGQRARAGPQDGAHSAPSLYSPGASSFPRKREPTGGRPLTRSGNLLEGASPTRKRSLSRHGAPRPQRPLPPRSRRPLPIIGRGGYEIPACAGMTARLRRRFRLGRDGGLRSVSAAGGRGRRRLSPPPRCRRTPCRRRG